jgi:hypothetical protein
VVFQAWVFDQIASDMIRHSSSILTATSSCHAKLLLVPDFQPIDNSPFFRTKTLV